jgi:hypothetical protein
LNFNSHNPRIPAPIPLNGSLSKVLRARQVLTVGAPLVIEETDSYGRTRAGGQDREETSFSHAISETAPGNFIGKETNNPNHEAKRVTHRNEPENSEWKEQRMD